MGSFWNRLFGWITARRPRLRCERQLWYAGTAELACRTRDRTRESGAYLLGETCRDGSKRILEFVFYDDIDPLALETGEVTIRQTALPRLWAHCRERGLGVVADIHVHPGSCRQSPSDQANPVMPRVGHLAMILPDFAQRRAEPGGFGIYEFYGGGQWRDHTARGARIFRLEDR